MDITKKEVRGLTPATLFQAIVFIAGLAIMYGNTAAQIGDLKTATKDIKESNAENKQATKETQQNNDVQHRLIINQMREQEIKIVQLQVIVEELKNSKR